jgi:hypothetical protein
MKSKFHPALAATLLFSFGCAPQARAQWLTHTAVPGATPGTKTTAVFAGGTGAYAGIVKVATSNVVDGISGTGVPGISANPFTNVTSTFTGFYPLNPGGTFDFLNLASNDTGDTFTVTFNFAGLAGHVLPAGTLIAFLDVDILENVSGLTANNGGVLTSPWLQQINFGPPVNGNVFDYNTAFGNGLTPGAEAAVSYSGGIYNLNGKNNNDDSAFQGFYTTVPIKSLTLSYNHSQGIFSGGGGYGIALAIPEPSTYALLGLGLLCGGARFLRRRTA